MVAAGALLATSSPVGAANVRTEVRLETTRGIIDIGLYDAETPATVANFLTYAGLRHYDEVMIHRSSANFVLQGGGYKFLGVNAFDSIFQLPPLVNEFSPTRSNVRGTISMAKISATDSQGNPIPGGGPDSATSQWFLNLADNSADLDHQNGGFTVFGEVLGSGMPVVDDIAALPVSNQSNVFPAFSELPVINYDESTRPPLVKENLVLVTNIPNVVSLRTLIANNLVVLATKASNIFSAASAIDNATSINFIQNFKPNPGEVVNFDRGVIGTIVHGVPGFTTTITMLYGQAFQPNRYYAYGPTSDNPADHWYDFSYDGETGAEITPTGTYLHFVEGKRGDSNSDATNGAIVHVGAPVIVTPTASGTSSSGCTVARRPTGATNAGGWAVVAMFLVVAGWRRRQHGPLRPLT